MHKGKELLQHAIAAGADGYILKEDAPTELIDAIKIIEQGQVYLSPLLVPHLKEAFVQDHRKGERSTLLSGRETEVLKLIADGKSDATLAILGNPLVNTRARKPQGHDDHLGTFPGFNALHSPDPDLFEGLPSKFSSVEFFHAPNIPHVRLFMKILVSTAQVHGVTVSLVAKRLLMWLHASTMMMNVMAGAPRITCLERGGEMPDWRLPQGRYIVKVTATSSGERITDFFQVENSVAKQHFRLMVASQQDISKVGSDYGIT